MQIHAAVSLITYRQSEVLILKRTPNDLDPWSGHLSLPGGRIEPEDKDPLDAARRETLEECGINLFPHTPTRELELERAGIKKEHALNVVPFHFDLDQKPAIELQLEEHCDYYWVKLDYLKHQNNHYPKHKSKDYPDKTFQCVNIEGNDLWGFTFKVIQDFLKTLNKRLS
jgi:8-oxo-dGTP pyrophosphatase MutT (NUDIX family)